MRRMGGWPGRLGEAAVGGSADPLTDKVLIAALLLWLAQTAALPLWAVGCCWPGNC